MTQLREWIKRSVPPSARDLFIDVRERLSPPPYEDIVLHDYEPFAETEKRLRLTLVINSIAPAKAFGGVTTGIEIFLEIGRRTGADLRILIDDFEQSLDTSVVDKRSRALGLDPEKIEFVPRSGEVPKIGVRGNEVFFPYTCWITLNIRKLVVKQANLFSKATPNPYIYIIQDYEPQFYPFSSTHMMSRLAYDSDVPYWGVFNSKELYSYFLNQGHSASRCFVFEPRLSDSLRPFLKDPVPTKRERILLYGRPRIPRNCFPAALAGVRAWARSHPEYAGWEVVSAGAPHKPMPIGDGRVMRSLGKLSLEEYADLLRTTAVGLSLMSSPHPSYPPLEMAHFGIITVTNRYANKNLSDLHDNIISVVGIDPDSIAAALSLACRRFQSEPGGAWMEPSRVPSFVEQKPFAFLDEIARDLMMTNV